MFNDSWYIFSKAHGQERKTLHITGEPRREALKELLEGWEEQGLLDPDCVYRVEQLPRVVVGPLGTR